MKYILLLLPLLLAGCRYTFIDGYAFDFKGSQAKRSESGALAAEVQVIQVENRFGDIEVRPAPHGDAMWTWDLTVWSLSSEEAETWAQQVTLQHDVSNGTAVWELVLPEPPARGLRGVQSNLTLSVPPTVEVRINNRGNVDVRDLAGRVDIRNRHGDVSAQGTAGVTEISNEHGKIVAEHTGPATIHSRHGKARVHQVAGDLEMQSQHADVEVVGVDGEFKLKCQHGDLEARDLSGAVRVANQHGAINVQASSGPVWLENQHGSINLDSGAADIECRNQHGDIRLALTNRELQRLQVEGSHSSIHAIVPPTVAGVRADVEHGDVYSEVRRAENSPIVFRTRHGDVRIERTGN